MTNHSSKGDTFLKFEIPGQLRDLFVKACRDHGISQSEMMRHLIRWWLEDLEAKEKESA